jgi:uncharacterized protein with gpF-like domain
MGITLSPAGVAITPRADFRLPFQEQNEFFGQKLDLPTDHWDDIKSAAHDRAFIVAGAAKADLLTDLRAAVNQAILAGDGLDKFRSRFDDIVEKHGWSYKGGRDWRTKIIYETNIRASYAAGRYAQLTDPALLKKRPYWKYIHNDSVQTPRLLHLAWGQKPVVLRYDDPWWKTHFPPNGFGCCCRVTAVRADQYQGESAPDNGTYEHIDRNGEVHTLPNGIDYSWDYAPGKSHINQLLQFQTQKLENIPYQLAKANTQTLMRNQIFKIWHNKIVGAALTLKDQYPDLSTTALIAKVREIVPEGAHFPVAVLSQEAKTWLDSKTQLVHLSDDDLAKQAIARYGQDFTAASYYQVQQVLDQAQRVLSDAKDIYTLFIHRGAEIFVAVLQRTKSGKAVFLKSFRRSNQQDADRSLRKTQQEGGKVLKDEL